MKKRRFEEACKREFSQRGGDHKGGRIVAGGFGGFGDVPPGLIEAIAGDRFDVVQHGPDEFEFIAKDLGESVRSAA